MDQSQDQQLAQVLVEFAHTLGTDFSVQRILDHLVARVVDILPVAGAGVLVGPAADDLHIMAASNDVVTAVEPLQNELREGPCLTAYETGEAVAVEDLARDTRFPRFSPRAAEAGLAAVFAFPMRLDGSRLGALDLYRDTPGSLTEDEARAGQVLADVAAAYLYNAQARIDASATVARLNHRSLHDALTGLPNRTLLAEVLDQAVARARRSRSSAAVLFLDLDGFKAVNDRHGHQVGDELLVAVARRLTGVMRPGDTLARLGGDEFVALCEDLADAAPAQALADRMIDTLREPFSVGGQRISVSASVGIAFSGPGQDIPDVLLRDADVAMYEAKAKGGDRHRLTVPGARLAADRRRALEDDLAQAQERGQFALHYQPIIDVRSRTVKAFEALLRWDSPERGQVLPEVVVPTAERTGMIVPLGAWVLQQACADLVGWPSADPATRVMVNVSAHQLTAPTFLRTLEDALATSGADPTRLCLEVTETVLLSDVDRALDVLRRVKELGVGLALDDFGTGYSSLGYLRSFPFDILKIDRSFTGHLTDDRTTRSIISAVIDLGHVLDLTVTAEGVERPEQLDLVVELGADHAQGYYVGRPLPVDRLGEDLVLGLPV